MRFLQLLLLMSMVCLLPACASIMSDNKSVTYLETTPEVAKCELHGQDFKRVITTPNSIPLPSEAAPITVACTAPGYKRTTATLDTKHDGWIWGNILLGGGIGLIVDAAKGSGFKFPPKYSIILEPEQFATLDERDAWFDRLIADVDKKWTADISKVSNQCKNSQSSGVGDSAAEGCKRLVAEAEKKKQDELALNEQTRKAAKVAQVEQAAASSLQSRL